jgi:hypothetical protein
MLENTKEEGKIAMLTKRDLKDIRWILVSTLKDLENKMLKSKDSKALQDFAIAKSDCEKLFNKVDMLIHNT